MLREGQGKEDKVPGEVEHLHPQAGVGTRATECREQKAQESRLTAGSPVQAPLAQALVRIDVGFATGACVRHILEVIDEAGDQAAAQITPHEAAKEAQHEVHQANLVGDLGGDGLLAVGTHCLHRCALKDLSLQHCHRSGSP